MPRILAATRHRAILRRLDESDSVTVEEMAATLGVSRETVRRDLKHLSRDGRLGLVHGGAVRQGAAEASFGERRARNRAGKEVIAALALGFVQDGMSLLIDSGTTTEALSELLARSGRQRLTIHTTSMIAARSLARLGGCRIRIIGGEFDPNDEATTGSEARRTIARLEVDVAFVGVGGLAEDGRVTDYTREGAAGRSAMLRAGARAYLLADHGKFGIALPSHVEQDATAAALLVDRLPSASLVANLASRGISVVAP